MKHFIALLLAGSILLAYVSGAAAALLWSNGDPTNRIVFGGNNIEITTQDYFNRRFFEEFTFAGAVTIVGLWSHNLIPTGSAGSFAQAHWSIYTSMTPESDGILQDEGVARVSLSANGQSRIDHRLSATDPDTQQYDGYQFLVSGLNVQLGSGTYFVAVTPILTSQLKCFQILVSFCTSVIQSTDGMNSIGAPVGNDNGIRRDYYYGSVQRFSIGDDLAFGVLGQPIPEPGLPGLMCAGIAIVVLRLLHHRNQTQYRRHSTMAMND